MKAYEKVYGVLEEMGIVYDLVEHPPALTTEEADRFIEGKEGVRTKTLLLCNKKSTAFYLVIMDDAKRLDMKRLGALLEEKGMRFCSSERLEEKLGLTPGTVSLFGLLNNGDRDVKVCLDEEMLSQRIMSFHANDNSKTIFISKDDMLRFLTKLGYAYNVLEL